MVADKEIHPLRLGSSLLGLLQAWADAYPKCKAVVAEAGFPLRLCEKLSCSAFPLNVRR